MTKNQVRGGGGREHDPVFPDAGLGINRGDAAIERLAGHSNLNDQKSGRGMGMSEIFVRPGDDRASERGSESRSVRGAVLTHTLQPGRPSRSSRSYRRLKRFK